MKAAINIKPGGSMVDPSGSLVTWTASNSIRVTHECNEVTPELVKEVAEQVAQHANLLRNLNDPDMLALKDHYVINVSISQPRPNDGSDAMVSASLDTTSVESFEDEDDDEGDTEG